MKKIFRVIFKNIAKKFVGTGINKTKIPALLNTSFNLHGEPVVNTVQDVLRVFEKSGLDVLWLKNHIIEKK